MRDHSLIGQSDLTYPHTRSAQRINYIGSLPQDIDAVNYKNTIFSVSDLAERNILIGSWNPGGSNPAKRFLARNLAVIRTRCNSFLPQAVQPDIIRDELNEQKGGFLNMSNLEELVVFYLSYASTRRIVPGHLESVPHRPAAVHLLLRRPGGGQRSHQQLCQIPERDILAPLGQAQAGVGTGLLSYYGGDGEDPAESIDKLRSTSNTRGSCPARSRRILSRPCCNRYTYRIPAPGRGSSRPAGYCCPGAAVQHRDQGL